MKKYFTIFSSVLILSFTIQNTSYSEPNNVLLEYCTGTWCQWCPCGHTLIQNILQNYPNTVVLSYHGAGSDPWLSYSLGMVQAFGFSSYPTGVVGRKTGIIDRDGWNNEVVLQSLLIQPGVSISIMNKNYDVGSRTLTANVVTTAATDLTGEYYINFVLTEDNLIYPQTGNGSCTGGSSYVHSHVVKSLVNGTIGDLIHSGTWTTGQQVNVDLNYVVPGSPQIANVDNCILNVYVYKLGTSISQNYNVQQTMKVPVTGTTGIINNNTVATEYKLSQNYPNPFNPTTSFSFSLPKSGNVSLKFYDILGNEIELFVDGFLNAGTYGVEFDGSKYGSGIYFYKLTTDNFTETKKMNLIK